MLRADSAFYAALRGGVVDFTFGLPVDGSKGAACGEDDEPEPEHQEYLLVHHVQGEKAHSIKFLRETSYHGRSYITHINLSNRAVSEEVTLCQLWKDLLHWVHLGLDR